MPASLLDSYLGEYFDGLLLDLAAHPEPAAHPGPAAPRLHVADTGAAYVVTLPAPGVALAALSLHYGEGWLTVRAPGFYRTVYLPEPVDLAGLTSTCAHEVLTVTLPRL